MNAVVTVFIGAGIGGVLRHWLNAAVTAWLGAAFPYGILTINGLGSTVMGLVAAWFISSGDADPSMRLFLATGILGGFTTFSAFSLDTVALIERGEVGAAAIYVVASVGLSVLGLAAGMWAMRAWLA